MTKPRTTPRENALITAEYGRNIALCVWDAITAEKPDDADILGLYAERLAACNSNSNLWTATDLHSDDGEAFDGSGRFWLCGSKLCTYCLKRQAQRARRQVREALAMQHVTPYNERTPLGLPLGQHNYFLTFTMPKPGLGIMKCREVMNDAWINFRNRTWFKRHILGGAKSEEFTQKTSGTHYHLHAIVRSKYIRYDDFRTDWNESVQFAFDKHKLGYAPKTKDGKAIANAKQITSIDNAIKEVAKYLTKSDSWAKVPASELLELCRIERWPRMFELFGTFALRPRGNWKNTATESFQPVAVPEEDLRKIENRLSLDTKALTDENVGRGWRDDARDSGVVEYLDKLESEQLEMYQIRKMQLRRHYAAAKFQRLASHRAINIELIRQRMLRIYELANKPPPPTLRIGMTLQQRIELNAFYGTEI